MSEEKERSLYKQQLRSLDAVFTEAFKGDASKLYFLYCLIIKLLEDMGEPFIPSDAEKPSESYLEFQRHIWKIVEKKPKKLAIILCCFLFLKK